MGEPNESLSMHRVVKTEGCLKWHVLSSNDRMVRRCSTKMEADVTCAIFNGDLTVAPAEYRRQFGRSGTEGAVLWAVSLDLSPRQCGANPETGEPVVLNDVVES